MKVYLVNEPRPAGIEPKIYFVKPSLGPASLLYGTQVLSFGSIKEAMQAIIDFNGSDEYLKELTFEEV